MDINYYVCTYDNEDPTLYTEGSASDKADEMMTAVSKFYAFSDCHSGRMLKIVLHGEEVHYTGWQPDMLMEYENDKGEVVWGGRFCSWEH